MAFSIRSYIAVVGLTCLVVSDLLGVSFEVASVKRHDPKQFSRPAEITPTQMRLVGHTLISTIMEAYAVKLDQIIGPEWRKTETYDIFVGFPPGADKSQIPALLKTLLEERFRLHIHWEDRERKVYLLVSSEPQLLRATKAESKRIVSDWVEGRINARAVTPG